MAFLVLLLPGAMSVNAQELPATIPVAAATTHTPSALTPTVKPPSGGPFVPTKTPTPLFGRPITPTPFVVPSPSVSPTPGTRDLPPPHLGYGVNIGPHSRVPYETVSRLRVDWVKLYDVPQLDDYPGMRTLYRLEIRPRGDLETFRREVMERAREVAAMGADAIEVGNEPNLISEWPPGPNPRQFTEMLGVAYQAIKTVAPHVVVVSGGLAPTLTTGDGGAMNDLSFASEMLAAGAGAYFDAFGYHPYGYNQPPEADPHAHELVFRRTERVRELLEAYGLRDRQIWITEYGWLRSPREDGVNCDGQAGFQGFEWLQFPGDVVADYTVRALQYADEHWPWVGPTFLWNLDWQMYEESYEPRCSQMRWFGILYPDGSPTVVFNRFAGAPRRFSEYRPVLGAWTSDMTEAVEAFCPTEVRIGRFKVLNEGYPAAFEAQVQPAQGPGIPKVGVSKGLAKSGDQVDVFVWTGDVEPGLHLIAVNMFTFIDGRRISTNVRGWVLAQPPRSPECVANAPDGFLFDNAQ